MVTLSTRNFTVKDKSLGRCSERSGYAGLEKFCKLEILHYEGMIPDLHYYAEDISEEAEFQAATHCYICEEDGTKWNADGTKNHCRGTITRLERTFQKVHGSTSTQFDWKYGRRHHPSLSAKFRVSIYNMNLFLNSVEMSLGVPIKHQDNHKCSLRQQWQFVVQK